MNLHSSMLQCYIVLCSKNIKYIDYVKLYYTYIIQKIHTIYVFVCVPVTKTHVLRGLFQHYLPKAYYF